MEPAESTIIIANSPAALTVGVTYIQDAMELEIENVRQKLLRGDKSASASYKDSISRKVRAGRPGARRHNRHVNASELHAGGYSSFSETDTDEDDEGGADEVVVEIAWRQHLAELCENQPLWYAISSCTEESQAHLLPPAQPPRASRAAGPGHLPRGLRVGLRRYAESPLLLALDAHARAVAAAQPPPAGPAPFGVCLLPGHSVQLQLPDAHVRRLAHSVAHYYALCSKSHTLPDGARVTVLKRPKKDAQVVLPELSLSQYLKRYEHKSRAPHDQDDGAEADQDE